MGLGVFATLLVVLSLLLSLRLDMFTLGRRRRRRQRRIFNRADPVSRFVKLALGGVVIPIAAFVAANRVELPGHRTPMSMALGLRLSRPETHAEQLGNAVLRAARPTVKVQGIVALQALGSSDALEQLLRILREDEAALAGGSEGQALSKALASYGVQARTVLLQQLEQTGPEARREAVAAPGDLFDRYFAADFAALKTEIDRGERDQNARAERGERLEVAQAELEHALGRLETEAGTVEAEANPRPADARRRLPAFVMQTFLAMSLKQDAELLSFARQAAADAAWSDVVRGQALLLVAKFGGKDDLEALYGYLESPSAVLQARAAEAIAALQSRLSAATEKG